MLPLVVVLGWLSVAGAHFNMSLYATWFDDIWDEVEDTSIVFDGKVPEYVRGTFMQAGPGAWSMGNMVVTHVFDGFAKYCRVHFEDDGTVRYTMKFLPSSFYNESVKSNKIASALLLADTVPPSRGVKDIVTGHLDNNYIKPNKIGNSEQLHSDTPISVCMKDDFSEFDYNIKPALFINTPGENWKDHDVEVPEHMCITASMAHGHLDPTTGEFIVAQGCQSPLGSIQESYHVVWAIHPSDPAKRRPLARIPMPDNRPPSYMHAIGATKDHIVLIAQPMHMDVYAVMGGKTLTSGLMYLGNETIFQVVNRKDGSFKNFPAMPSFLFAHVFNTWEEDGDILMDISWYKADDNLAFMKVFLFENVLNKKFRDSFAPPRVVRFRLTKHATIEQTFVLPEEDTKSVFELPAIDERRQGLSYCVLYPWQGNANAYDEDKQSTKVGPSGTFAIGKRNFCTGERSGIYVPNEYPGEVKFVPNPDGTEEDDGVLIGLVYNATGNSSFFQVIDAKTMNRVAVAQLPARTPFPLHSTFFPAAGAGAVEALV